MPDKTRLRSVALLMLSVALAIALFEFCVRFFDLDYNPSAHWYYHPVLGWTQELNVNFDYTVAGAPVRVEFNSLGFRDIEHAVQKPPGVKRIVVIGDSFSEAAQVNLADTYFIRLGNLLEQVGGQRWEAINVGVGDFGTAQAWLALKGYGLAYDPDLIVLQVFALNDVCNNTIELYRLCLSKNDRYRPYLVERDGDLVLTSKHPLQTFLRRNLVSYGLLEWAYLKLTDADSEVMDDDWRLAEMEKRGFQPIDPIYASFSERDSQIDPVKKGWRMTERILEKIALICREHGIPVIGLVIPNQRRIKLPDEAYPERRLQGWFSQIGVPVVMMKPVFDQHKARVLPYWEGHLNPYAHGLTAKALLDEVRSSFPALIY